MASPKIILYKHKTYSDGLHPVCIQVIKNGKAIRKVIGKCSKKDWLPSKSRVSHRNIEAARINNDIEKALRNYGVEKSHTMQSLWQQQIDNYKTKGQVSRYLINDLVFRQLIEFYPEADFEHVTETFIYRFVAHLDNNPGTIKEKMNVFSAVLQQARKMKLITDNPFEWITFRKVRSSKTKLTVEELKLLMNAEIDGRAAEARDVFIACVYLRGVRIGDVLFLKPSNIVDGRLKYIEIKTGEQHNVHISPELMEIFEKWSGKNRFGYMFSFLQVPSNSDIFIFKAGMKNAINKCSRYIKNLVKQVGIEKEVSPHTARHSFSKLANETIANTSITKDLIGHATLSIHEVYISDITDDLIMDGYAKKVLDQLK